MDRRLLLVSALVCAASIGDAATTWYGIEHAGLYEANPGAQNVLDAHGYGGMLAAKAIPAVVAIGLSAASAWLWADENEWKWYAPAIAVVALNALVTAYNGLLIVAAG